MPVQTTEKGYVYFPDGAKVSVGDSIGTLVDVGAINSAAQGTVNWTENQVETANAGKLDKQIKEMTIDISFTLINLDPDGLEEIGSGVFTKSVVTGAAVPTPVSQVISAGGWANLTPTALLPTDSNGVILTAGTLGGIHSAITSVTASTAGALTVDVDYFLVFDANSKTGESIYFDTGGLAGVTLAENITVAFGSITPVASTSLTMGTSTLVLTPKVVQFEHTDSAGLKRTLTMYAADVSSGGLVFSFKGANEDGVEEMPITMTGRLDTSLADGSQLLEWKVDAGAA